MLRCKSSLHNTKLLHNSANLSGEGEIFCCAGRAEQTNVSALRAQLYSWGQKTQAGFTPKVLLHIHITLLSCLPITTSTSLLVFSLSLTWSVEIFNCIKYVLIPTAAISSFIAFLNLWYPLTVTRTQKAVGRVQPLLQNGPNQQFPSLSPQYPNPTRMFFQLSHFHGFTQFTLWPHIHLPSHSCFLF